MKGLRAASVKLVAEGKIEEGLEVEKLIHRIEARMQNHQSRLNFLQPRAVFDLKGSGFALKSLRNSATAYANKDFVWMNVPEQIKGWQFTQIAGGDTPDIRVTIKRGGVVFVAANATTDLEKDGWQRLAHINFAYQKKWQDRLILLSKKLKANQEIKISHEGWAGTLVLIPD